MRLDPRKQVPEYPGVQFEPPVLDELQHCHGRNGLGEARDTEERVRLNGDLVKPIRHSEPARINEAPVPHDRYGSAGNAMVTHGPRHDPVVRLQPRHELPRLYYVWLRC